MNSFAKFTSTISISSKFNQEPEILHAGAYLVIGVFQDVNNARQFAESALQEGLNAHYKYHQQNQLIYVYTHSENSKNNILPTYYQIRETTKYKDAWILSVQDNTNPDLLHQTTSYHSSLGNAEGEELPLEDEKQLTDQLSEKITVAFRALDCENGDTTAINAQIQVVDGKQASLIEQTDTKRGWAFIPKTLNLDTVQVITESIGYRKNQVNLSIHELLKNSKNPNIHLVGDTLFVQIEMRSLEAGEYQVMYNTYFYGNSTVMREHSKYELEKVYNVLRNNPDMKIRLHGHTNGNSRGVAYLYDEEKQNFFEIIRTKAYRKRGVSSTKLSHYRAETIKSYLVFRGIDTERIETQGWGGKKMLYAADSPMASNNIRVEIEVISK
ncbi:OmpA family protein [Catalinimonas sp. 4WD22]|uniref:OmpA family protein n=1 Tax=Catalinimonas locisalis TaxID=3133978 RepID=UPI0031019934